MDKTYTLTLTEKQARILVRALDLFTRIGIGQFEEMIRVFDPACRTEMTKLRVAENHVAHAQRLVTGFPENASFGIHAEEVSDDFRMARDIGTVIRNRLAWDRTPAGGMGVDFDEPRAISREALPTIAPKDV